MQMKTNEKSNWSVHVGNLGTVYDGESEEEAREAFDDYVELSDNGHGRVANEPVTLCRDGDEVAGYSPGFDDEEQ